MLREKLGYVVARVRSLLRRRFHSRNEKIPYYITILVSAIIFVISMNAFVSLTRELIQHRLHPIDDAITARVLSFRSPVMTRCFTLITHLGDRNAYFVAIAILALFFYVRHRSWRFIAETTIVLLLSSLSNLVLKREINRTRPSLEHLVSVDSLSYPSGHAMAATAFYGFLAYLCLRLRMQWWLRSLCVILLTCLILAIGISRIYLGVHFPTDVIGGFIAGLIWVTFCAILFNLADMLILRRRRAADDDA